MGIRGGFRPAAVGKSSILPFRSQEDASSSLCRLRASKNRWCAR